MSRRSAKPDRTRYPHDYTGPTVELRTSPRALRQGEACRIIGNRAGGRRIETPDGKTWIVGRNQVERAK